MSRDDGREGALGWKGAASPEAWRAERDATLRSRHTRSGSTLREGEHFGLSRRGFLALGGAAALVAGSGCGAAQPTRAPFSPLPLMPREAGTPHTLPELPYAYDALDDAIDAMTMEIHHTRHHQAYVNNLNRALEAHPRWFDVSLEDLMVRLPELPEDIRMAVRNNGGGHYNHILFWEIMHPEGARMPTGALAAAIDRDLGGWDAFVERFRSTAAGVFGSGWAWLSSDPAGRLQVHGTPNQDTPLAQGLDPLMGVDVWEHAYYLRYQNERGRYVDAFLEVVDWDAAAARYARITGA